MTSALCAPVFEIALGGFQVAPDPSFVLGNNASADEIPGNAAADGSREPGSDHLPCGDY